MSNLIKRFKSILKGLAGLTGISLIDPIEVFFIPETNTFYPIISKSGCSSIKLMLIRRYKPDYENVFPGIHAIDPALLTGNKVLRLYFKTSSAYAKWTHGKHMVFVMREPISRFYSCYFDVKTGKNIMYEHPSNLDWWMASKFSENMSFEDFTKNVISIPDHLSDRHFRSQCFYLSQNVKNNLASLEAYTLKAYMTQNGDKKGDASAVTLNTNNTSIPLELKTELISNSTFQKRFKQDFVFFETIKTNDAQVKNA